MHDEVGTKPGTVLDDRAVVKRKLASRSPRSRFAVVALSVVLFVACNEVLGIDEPRAPDASGGASGSGAAGSSGVSGGEAGDSSGSGGSGPSTGASGEGGRGADAGNGGGAGDDNGGGGAGGAGEGSGGVAGDGGVGGASAGNAGFGGAGVGGAGVGGVSGAGVGGAGAGGAGAGGAGAGGAGAGGAGAGGAGAGGAGPGGSSPIVLALVASDDATIQDQEPGQGLDRYCRTKNDVGQTCLLRWDLSSIPPGSPIQNVDVEISLQNVSPQPYFVYPVRARWSELTVSWIDREAETPWELPGAKGSLDRASAVGTVLLDQLGPYTVSTQPSWIALVQSWVNMPSTNFGVSLTSPNNDNGAIIYTKESSDSADHPRLIVTYLPPSGSGGAGGGGAGGSGAGGASPIVATRVTSDDATIQDQEPGQGLDRYCRTKNELGQACLLRWDLSSMPPGSAIQNVDLEVALQNVSPQPYFVYPLRVRWSEQTVTWVDREAETPWELPGANGSLDRASAAGTVLLDQAGPYTVSTQPSWIALVQSWVNVPSTNFGVSVTSPNNDDGAIFYTKESSDSADHPRLTVTYLPPPAP